MKTTFLFVVIFISNIVLAQDSLNFPLQIGNYWEYSAMFEKESWKVKSDTVMPNGKQYYSIEVYDFTHHYIEDVNYFRADSGKLFEYFPALQCSEKEIVYLDFSKGDKEIWAICELGYRGVDTSFVTYNYTFQKNINVKGYDVARIENGDTLWGPPVVDGDGPRYASPGIGIISWFEAFTGDLVLTGAILNGVKYGTITAVNSEDLEPKMEYSLSDNYPNPFNPATEITYSIKKSGFVTVKVFDVLGREIVKLVNEAKNVGTYSVTFKAKDIPSGIYFYTLDVNDFSVVKKMVLLK